MLPFLLLACTSSAQKDTAQPDSAAVDVDGDGLTSDVDCDDADASVGTGPTWYADEDGDQYGAAEGPLTACSAPDGYVADATDCDDGDADVHPGADEVCGGGDEDCDGLVDDDDARVLGTTRYYVDADGDGVGGSSGESACDPPSGTVAESGDCDDSDPAVYPRAEETCGDGVDSDCAGPDSECRLAWEGSASDLPDVLVGDAGGGAGWAFAALGDTDGDGVTEVAVSDPFADDRAGAVYVVAGPGPGATPLSASVGRLRGGADAELGEWLASADLDGDGGGDVVASLGTIGLVVTAGVIRGEVSAVELPTWSCAAGVGGLAAGAVGPEGAPGVVVSLRSTGAPVRILGDVYAGGEVDTAAVGFDAATEGGLLGSAVAVGDTDGDGLDDLLVGATGAADGYGQAWLWTGPFAGRGTEADAAATFTACLGCTRVGAAVALADMEGDGLADVIVSDPAYQPEVGSLNGRVSVFTSPVRGELDLDADSGRVVGADARYEAGETLAVGDNDADGRLDLLVGAPTNGADNQGTVVLTFGPVRGAHDLESDDDAVFRGATADAYLGQHLGIGDLDGDGGADVLLGDPYSPVHGDGAVWIGRGTDGS